MADAYGVGVPPPWWWDAEDAVLATLLELLTARAKTMRKG